MKKFLFVLAFSQFLMSFCNAAEEFTLFDCTIKHVYSVSDNGALKMSGWQDQFIGGKFTVERKTGSISGQTLTTVMAKETAIINYGSSENSFKAVAVFPSQIQLIEIQMFKNGALKPFVASSMGGAGIVTGMCGCK